MKLLGKYLAVIGADAAPFGDALAAECADVLLLPPAAEPDRRIACHPDTLLARVGNALVTAESYAARYPEVIDGIRRCTEYRIVLSRRSWARKYPSDTLFNILSCGKSVYAREASLAPEVREEMDAQGFSLHSVKQGYAGCSALACGNLVLSADPSVCRAVLADGMRVLRLAPGGIALPGYDCGFIGGASGYAEKTAVFFGDPLRHPDGQRITETLEAEENRILPLSRDPLCDYGGILFLEMK